MAKKREGKEKKRRRTSALLVQYIVHSTNSERRRRSTVRSTVHYRRSNAVPRIAFVRSIRRIDRRRSKQKNSRHLLKNAQSLPTFLCQKLDAQKSKNAIKLFLSKGGSLSAPHGQPRALSHKPNFLSHVADAVHSRGHVILAFCFFLG